MVLLEQMVPQVLKVQKDLQDQKVQKAQQELLAFLMKHQ
jgi:hypothetical protein